MDDPATRAHSATTPRRHAIRAGALRWRGPLVAVAAVLAVVAVPVVLTRLLTPGEPGWSLNGITLNTSSAVPTAAADGAALIVSVVRIDPNGCVYLRSPGSVRNVVWPTGYTASRQPDGTVTIANPDGLAVAATGHRLRASGVEAPPDIDLACRAQGSYFPALMVIDELPPLNE